ncbi:hypothetical protein, partial [Novipirellula sp.]|uniref:hypothetical protein n=1 Tax=Novipirellula sp. TaxID=2795430 RepID=UPI003564122D
RSLFASKIPFGRQIALGLLFAQGGDHGGWFDRHTALPLKASPLNGRCPSCDSVDIGGIAGR